MCATGPTLLRYACVHAIKTALQVLLMIHLACRRGINLGQTVDNKTLAAQACNALVGVSKSVKGAWNKSDKHAVEDYLDAIPLNSPMSCSAAFSAETTRGREEGNNISVPERSPLFTRGNTKKYFSLQRLSTQARKRQQKSKGIAWGKHKQNSVSMSIMSFYRPS